MEQSRSDRSVFQFQSGDHNTPQFSEVGVKFVFVGNVSSGYLHFEGSRFVTRDYFMAIKPQRVPRRGKHSLQCCRRDARRSRHS